MAKEGNVKVNVLGDVSNLSKNLKKGADDVGTFAKGAGESLKSNLGSAIDTVTGRFGKLGQAAGDKLKGLAGSAVEAGGTVGLAVGAGAAAGVAAIAELGIKGIASFVGLVGEVKEFQRVAGGSTEDASLLVAALKDVGIDAGTGANAMFKLTRQIAQHADVLKADGVEIAHNRDGTIDLSNTLLNVGDAYKQAGAGAKGNQVAFDAFGKSGAALIPILTVSRDTLEEFYKAAKDHHEVITDADKEKAREYKLALHDMSEAMGGFERSIGTRVIPFLSTMAEGLSKITDKATDLSSHLHGINIAKNFFEALPGVGQLGSALELVAGKSHTAAKSTDELKQELEQEAQAAQDTADALDSLLDSTLSAFNSDLAYADATNSVEDAIANLGKVAKESGTNTEEYGRATTDAAKAVLTQAAAAEKLAEDQADLAGKTLTASEKATIEKNELQKVASTLAPGSPLRQQLDAYIAQLEKIPATVATSVFFQTPSGKTGAATTGSTGGIDRSYIGGAKAGGGPVKAGVPYLVGEKGPEIVVPAQSGNVVPNNQVGGQVINAHFENHFHGLPQSQIADVGREVLWTLRRVT